MINQQQLFDELDRRANSLLNRNKFFCVLQEDRVLYFLEETNKPILEFKLAMTNQGLAVEEFDYRKKLSE